MIKQAIKIICIFLFLLSQLQAQAKLESFERAYFGFALEGNVVAPWQIEPSPNPDVQLAGLPNFAHTYNLRMIYNISDRLFASCQAGLGLAHFRNKVSFEGIEPQVMRDQNLPLAGLRYSQIQFALQYRFLPRANWSPYISVGLGVFKARENRYMALTGISYNGLPLPAGIAPPASHVDNPYTLYYRASMFQTSMKTLNFGLGLSKKLRNRKQLLLLELRYQHSRNNYLGGFYHFPYYDYIGSMRAYFSQLSFSVSYLFS